MRMQAKDAAKVVGVQPRTIHKWVREGWINRYPDGYDLAELLAAERNRNHAALMVRAGLSKTDWPSDPNLIDGHSDTPTRGAA
jgi:uncharacterized protein YjcR